MIHHYSLCIGMRIHGLLGRARQKCLGMPICVSKRFLGVTTVDIFHRDHITTLSYDNKPYNLYGAEKNYGAW